MDVPLQNVSLLAEDQNGKSDPRLQNLFDYTKFHIGLYATLLTLLFTAVGYTKPNLVNFLKFTIVFFVLAGACGGIVASNAYESKSFADFQDTKIGIPGIRLPGRVWAHLEHLFFWIGISIAVVGILFFTPWLPAKEILTPL